MSDTSNNTLLLRTLQEILENGIAVQAALLRVEHAFTRHVWTFAKNEQRNDVNLWFSRIDQRFSGVEKRLDGIEADIRATTNRLASVIRLEIGKQIRLLLVQAARQSQRLPAP